MKKKISLKAFRDVKLTDGIRLALGIVTGNPIAIADVIITEAEEIIENVKEDKEETNKPKGE